MTLGSPPHTWLWDHRVKDFYRIPRELPNCGLGSAARWVGLLTWTGWWHSAKTPLHKVQILIPNCKLEVSAWCLLYITSSNWPVFSGHSKTDSITECLSPQIFAVSLNGNFSPSNALMWFLVPSFQAQFTAAFYWLSPQNAYRIRPYPLSSLV